MRRHSGRTGTPTLDNRPALAYFGTSLYSGPPIEAGTFSDAVLGAVAHVAERIGSCSEKFLRDLLVWFVDQLKLVEEQSEAGLLRLPHGIDFQVVAHPPLPIRSKPTFTIRDPSEAPAPNENVAWSTRVNWERARDALEAGKALCFQIDPPEMEAARDAIASRIGFDVVTRLDITRFELWVMRPEAETANSRED